MPACTLDAPWVGAEPLGPLTFLSGGDAGLAPLCRGLVGAGVIPIFWHRPWVQLAALLGCG